MSIVRESLPRPEQQYVDIDEDRLGCRCCESLPDTPCPAWCEYAKAGGRTKAQHEDIEAVKFSHWQSDTAQKIDKQGRRPAPHALLKARYRSVYVEQSRIKAQHPRPIRIDDREGLIIYAAGVDFSKGSLVYAPNHEDGSCLWFETSEKLFIKDPEIGAAE